MGTSAVKEPKKLLTNGKNVVCADVVELVDRGTEDNIRNIVETAFTAAKRHLACSRASKIRENLAKAACSAREAGESTTSDDSNSEDVAVRAAWAVPTLDKRHIRMKKVDTPPHGLAWLRVQANVAIPEKYEHDFHVPYLGESDAKIKSSNTLAMDLFQQDLDDEGNDSEIEEYPGHLVAQDDGTAYIEDVSERNLDSENKSGSSSHGKMSSPPKKSSQKKRRKHSLPIWDRAVKRVALKDIMDQLGIDSTESIEIAVCEVFGLQNPYYVAAYHTNISTRIKLWKKHDDEEHAKHGHHDEVVKHACGEITTSALEVLKSESITFFVCRQCYTYVCAMHGYQNDARPIKKPIDRSKKENLVPQAVSEIEAKCEDRERGKCWCAHRNELDGTEWSEKFKSNAGIWNDVQAVLRELFETFGHDPCRMSSMMRSFLPHVHSMVLLTCNRVGFLCEQSFSADSDAKKTPGRNYFRQKKPQSKWSKSKVRRPVQEIESMQGGLRLDYVPCRHEGACSMKNCVCMQNGLLCEKFCGCNHTHVQHGKSHVICSNAYRGCACKSIAACASKACLCFSMNRECDPDLCRQCHDCKDEPLSNGKRWTCMNEGLRMNEKQRTVVGHSKVHGWGVFAVSNIQKNEIIGEYVGELIKQEEAERRGRVYDEINYSFLFNTTKDYALDSTRLGNKLRYCNHSSKPNCEPKVMRVGGDVRVGLYAKRNIAKNEELFFNYGYNDGPAWAMQGQAKGSAKRKGTSVVAKTKSSSDLDSIEVLPVSSRRRKTLDQELEDRSNVNVDMTSDESSPVKRKSRKRRKHNADEYTLVPVKVADDEVVALDDVSADKNKKEPPKSSIKPQKLALSLPGRSVWRGVLRRVSVGAADVESPGRRLSRNDRGHDRSGHVPELKDGLTPTHSRDRFKLLNSERKPVKVGGRSSSRQVVEDGGHGQSSVDRNAIDAGQSSGQQPASRKSVSHDSNVKAGMVVMDAPERRGAHLNSTNDAAAKEELRAVFGSDCEVDSDGESGEVLGGTDVKPPCNYLVRQNGMRSSRSPSGDEDTDSERECTRSQQGRLGRMTAEVTYDSPDQKRSRGSNPGDLEDTSTKRRYSSEDRVGDDRDRLLVRSSAKRLRLLEGAVGKSLAPTQRSEPGESGSARIRSASLSKMNGSVAARDNHKDISPAKRRLFSPSRRPSSEHSRREGAIRTANGPQAHDRDRSQSERKTEDRTENGAQSATDDDGTDEVVPVVNLVSDDDGEGEGNGTREPNFSSWFT